ncbi:MAG: pilin, partial [Gammaproteobacteria bacterium]
GLKTNIAEVYGQEGRCPGNGSFGIPVDGSITGKYVLKVDTAGGTAGPCTITATMKPSGISKGIISTTVIITMKDNGGSTSWRCSSTAAQKYLPASCTGT